ncbi:MAG: DoxX family protein [Kofleriaceae bacterium]
MPLGRVLFALLFLTSVFGHFSSATISYAAAHGVPVATLVVPVAGLVAFAGGAMVMVGYRARLGACLLVMFLVPVTLVMHAFWSVADPQRAQLEQAMFMKNAALVGGALLVLYWGSGPYSVDR